MNRQYSTSQKSNTDMMSKDDDTLTEQSSNHSSYKELVVAEEHALRTSFRAVSGNDNPLSEIRVHDVYSVPRESVHVYSYLRDSKLDTPDSIVSSGSVTIMNVGGQTRSINASNLQQNYDNQPPLNAETDITQIGENDRKMDDSEAESEHVSTYNNNFFLGRSMRTQLRKENASSGPTNESGVVSKSKSQNEETFPYEEKHQYVDEKKPAKGDNCFPKLVLFCIVLLALVAGVVVLIYFKKEPESNRREGFVIPRTTEKPRTVYEEICPTVSLKFRDQISFSCDLVAADVLPHRLTHIRVRPPLYWNEGKPFHVEIKDKFKTITSNETTTDWNAEIDHAYRILMIEGSRVTCNADGRFELEFVGRNESLLNTSVTIIVKSEVHRVNVSLSQNIEKNPDDFVLGCSTNSGCETSHVDFFAVLNNKTQKLIDVNFTCTVTYDVYNGYNVACFGTIPDFLLSKFEKITCVPKSSILSETAKDELSTEIELPECNLTEHCGYKCKDDSDYFVVSSGRCDIFHRCYGNNQVATSYCAPGTFFDPGDCACRHTGDLPWCQKNGALKPNSNVADKTCAASDKTV